MERIEPSNGVKMPAMNFGVYRITDPAECEAAVLSAIKAGWRGIDTAASYLNEKAVGRAVASSGIPRSELFISTKLWAPIFFVNLNMVTSVTPSVSESSFRE